MVTHQPCRPDIFHAIADPNRRAIIVLLTHQSLTLNAIARNFTVSRPAVSKHIRILAECGLVRIERRGRERYCSAQLSRLNEVSDWIERSRGLWAARLDSLEQYLTELQQGNNQEEK